MSEQFGTPRPLWRVILLSSVTALAYYGWYKWLIQDELRRYRGHGWSGALCLIPFAAGVILPQLLRLLEPDLPDWFGVFSLLGVVWIYIVQFRLYREVNALYCEAHLKPPLQVWWLFVPGLNLWVGLRQIHFLSRYWAMRRGEPISDPVADRLPLFFSETSLFSETSSL